MDGLKGDDEIYHINYGGQLDYEDDETSCFHQCECITPALFGWILGFPRAREARVARRSVRDDVCFTLNSTMVSICMVIFVPS